MGLPYVLSINPVSCESMPVKGARKLCGAKLRNKDAICTNPAMENGRCRLHGGLTPKGVLQGNFKTGRYSSSLPVRLAAKYEELRNDPELLNISDEIAILRTRLSDLLDRSDSGQAQESWQRIQELARSLGNSNPEQVGQEILEIANSSLAEYQTWSDIQRTMEQLRKLTDSERARLKEMQSYLDTNQVLSLAAALLASVKSHVQDKQILHAIATDFDQLLNKQ